MKKLLLSALFLAVLVVPAIAEDKPLLSFDRVSASVGPSLRFKPNEKREVLVGAQLAYQVVPHLSLSGTANYNFSSLKVDRLDRLEYTFGLRLRVK